MALERKNLVVLNPNTVITRNDDRDILALPCFAVYASADAKATIVAADYFLAVCADKVLNSGSLILVTASDAVVALFLTYNGTTATVTEVDVDVSA